MLKLIKVPGEKSKHKVFLYALSTCAWCKMTKKFLNDNKVQYEYVDVDLCTDKERAEIRKDIERHGGEAIYPTIIVDDKVLITGFLKNKISEALDI